MIARSLVFSLSNAGLTLVFAFRSFTSHSLVFLHWQVRLHEHEWHGSAVTDPHDIDPSPRVLFCHVSDILVALYRCR